MSVSHRRPVTLTRAQERLLYARLEAPTAARRESPVALLGVFLMLGAGLLLAIWLGP
jgi:hypothetical protein